MTNASASITKAAVVRRVRPWNLYVGVGLVGLMVCMALVSFLWLPHDPIEINIVQRFKAPDSEHLLGTDQYGRDLFSRILVGARTTMAVGIIAVGLGVTVGTIIGGAAALSGGWRDELFMRLMDAVGAYPPVLSALLLASIMGPGPVSGMLAIGIASVPVFARLTRANVLSLRETDFIEAARAMGAGNGRILARHLWPNTASIVLVQATIAFAHAVLAEAALSYLGLGTQPPTPSWGRMLREAQDFLIFSPYPAVFPGAAIALTVLGLNLLGDGLRDVLDPRSRRG